MYVDRTLAPISENSMYQAITQPELDEVLKPVKALGLPSHKTILVGGAALVVWGIKSRVADYDIVVSPSCMVGEAQAIGQPTKKGTRQTPRLRHYSWEYGTRSEVIGNITIMRAPDDHLFRATFTELKARSRMVSGVYVLRPEAVLAWKRAIGRKKDLVDIQRIERFLATNDIAA